jgi:methyl-accepting chemotaxis protein
VSQIYNLMVKKVSADDYDYNLADILPERAAAVGKQLSAMMEEIETSAKGVIRHAETEAQKATARAFTLLLTATAIGVGCAVVLALLITRMISRPVAQAVRFAEKMAMGDLTQTLSIDQKDEIGVLAQALNRMVAQLAGMFKEVASGVHTLSTSSEDLVNISQNMKQEAEDTSGRSNSVATAAEEMSANMSSVTLATEQAAEKVNLLAEASGRVDDMVVQISQHSGQAQTISDKAVAEMQTISQMVCRAWRRCHRDRRSDRRDPGHLGAGQPAGSQCHHRSGPGRRGRQGVRRGGPGDQGAGPSDRPRHQPGR